MAKGIMNVPLPTKERGQRSSNLSDTWLTRFTPAWQRPPRWDANTWRSWILQQPVAIICRETLIANLLSLDWKITPRDMKYKDELDGTIKHYTRLLEQGGNNPELSLDYSSLVEWVAADLLDTAFGGVAEVGRKGDSENGRVMWLKPVDAATMYPTLNREFPAVQYWTGLEAIPFPAHAMARTYMSPRPWMDRQGWGIAPPEKVYFALELLNRGDKYYANLLLDIPTAGILDLGDMEKASAEEWVDAFRTFMNDTETAFRVPVLYEHNNPVQYIPFGKEPNNIMFDKITQKYASIVASAYGMTLNDIGLAGGGDTLAGTIRSDVKYNKTGFARVKAKMEYFFNQILPPTLQFLYIDYDSESNVAMGRARLATASAFKMLQELKQFSPQELRQQAIADGLFSITLPDQLPDESEFPEPEMQNPNVTQGTGMKKKVGKATGTSKSGNPKSPREGGEGEFNTRSLDKDKIRTAVNKIIEAAPHLHRYMSEVSEDEVQIAKADLLAESALSQYVEEVSEMTGLPMEFVWQIATLVIELLEEFVLDGEEEVIYDGMVETMLSILNRKEKDGN